MKAGKRKQDIIKEQTNRKHNLKWNHYILNINNYFQCKLLECTSEKNRS